MRKMIRLLAIGLVMGTGWIATAQAHNHGHKGHGAHHSHGHKSHGTHNRTSPDTPAVREYKAAHAKMMRDMDISFTGNPDVDFRRHMIRIIKVLSTWLVLPCAMPKTLGRDNSPKPLSSSSSERSRKCKLGWHATGRWCRPVGSRRTSSVRTHILPTREDPGSQGELRGQSWAPHSGVPAR